MNSLLPWQPMLQSNGEKGHLPLVLPGLWSAVQWEVYSGPAEISGCSGEMGGWRWECSALQMSSAFARWGTCVVQYTRGSCIHNNLLKKSHRLSNLISLPYLLVFLPCFRAVWPGRNLWSEYSKYKPHTINWSVNYHLSQVVGPTM